MTERNEQTSPTISTFAAKVMKMDDAELVRQAYTKPDHFRALAASCLTQAPDKATEPKVRKTRAAQTQPE